MGHRLLPRLTNSKQYLYQETDEMQGFYFINEGQLAFVVASAENAIFKKIQEGSMPGFEDYMYHLLEQPEDSSIDLAEIDRDRSTFTRKFTLITRTKVEALELHTSEVLAMQTEYPAIKVKLDEMVTN